MATINLTTENFTDAVEANETLVIDFWAQWCGPCQQFAPIFEKVAENNPELKFAKVNTEEQQELAAQFGIRSIPTLVVIKEGVLVLNKAGMLQEGAFNDVIRQAKELDMGKVHEEIKNEADAQVKA
ncbi:MAG: thioredoxin [Arcobacter sp.]|nr:MAG: thioredoxin [Arcobacter sp.]